MGENKYFTDDAKLLADMIKNQWSLGPENTPNIEYTPEKWAVDGRVGLIYIYPISRSNQRNSIDYSTIERKAQLSIKISNRHRNNHYAWCEEVYRILLANRRKGIRCMNGWGYLEILNDRQRTDLQAQYTTTIDVRLTVHAKGIESLGLGDRLNNQLDNSAEQE